jgi:hypothetical protein
MVARVCGHRYQSIVSRRFAFLGLLRLNYSNQLCGHQASDEGGLIHQNQNVERISIAAFGGRKSN